MPEPRAEPTVGDVDAYEQERPIRQAIVDQIAPAQWNVTVWLDSNYVNGRLDVADQHAVVGRVLDGLRSAGYVFLSREDYLRDIGIESSGRLGPARTSTSEPSEGER